jgi:signal transduction histidine kinase
MIERELARAGRLLGDLDAVRGAAMLGWSEPPGLVVVPELMAEVSEMWSHVALTHGRRLWIEPWDEVLVVRGDAGRLAQALGNLVANALEHGAGTVRLATHGGSGRVAIEVADEGGGLPAPVPELVRGARGGRGARGRGLAIAAEIANAHGGRLDAQSDKRTRLVLDLPAAAGTAAGPRPTDPLGAAAP